MGSDHSCYQQSSTVVTPQVFSTVENKVRPSEPVINNHRRLCCQHLRYAAEVEQEASQLRLAVAIFLFSVLCIVCLHLFCCRLGNKRVH